MGESGSVRSMMNNDRESMIGDPSLAARSKKLANFCALDVISIRKFSRWWRG